MKDPAFLFYFNEVSHDIYHLSRLERGCYLDLIIAQKKFGPLTEDQIKKILADDYEKCWPSLKICFTYDEDMKTFYLEWLDESIKKRKAFSESRRKNRLKSNSKDINLNSPLQSILRTQPQQHINDISYSNENDMGNGNGVVVENLNKQELEKNSPSHLPPTTNHQPPTLFAIWGKPNPSLGEIQILEKLISEYSFEEVRRAFYISEEQGIKKLSYVKGILKKQRSAKIKEEKNKKLLNSFKQLPPEEKQNWNNFSREFIKSIYSSSHNSSDRLNSPENT